VLASGRLSPIATTCERQNDFETSQPDAFAAPGFHLASGIFGLTAESRFNHVAATHLDDPFVMAAYKRMQRLQAFV
jgi:hypothetical protein